MQTKIYIYKIIWQRCETTASVYFTNLWVVIHPQLLKWFCNLLQVNSFSFQKHYPRYRRNPDISESSAWIKGGLKKPLVGGKMFLEKWIKGFYSPNSAKSMLHWCRSSYRLLRICHCMTNMGGKEKKIQYVIEICFAVGLCAAWITTGNCQYWTKKALGATELCQAAPVPRYCDWHL